MAFERVESNGSEDFPERREFSAGKFRVGGAGAVRATGKKRHLAARADKSDCSGIRADWNRDAQGDGNFASGSQAIEKGALMPRTAKIHRKTAETDIRLQLNLDGRGKSRIATGIRFFDHMLDLVARHGAFELVVEAKGDLDVDQHHTVEDVGI